MPKKFRCPKCERSFGMPAHLARHMSTIHGTRPKGAAKRVGQKRLGRPAGRAGRPAGITSRLGLRALSLEELGEVITEARRVARRKIAEFNQSVK